MQFSVFFLLLSIFNAILICENKLNKISHVSDDLPLLGYIHGYKIGQNAAYKYPGILVSPIIIVPVYNSKQNSDNPIEHNEKKEQNTTALTAKIILHDNETKDDDDDIEANFRQALGRGSKKDLRQVRQNETLEIVNDSANSEIAENTTKEAEVTTSETSTTEENVTINKTSELHSSTEAHGLYPNAPYNNKEINSLTITIKGPDDVLYPPLSNEQWKNFTHSTNITLKENITIAASSDSLNISGYPSVIGTDSLIKGVYPAALYNNAEIDQLSITTNSYTNRSPLPPPQDDRWRSFASLRKMLPTPTSNEFRPLAGLYYDGFLHRPIHKTQGFVPYNYYYLY